MFCHGCVSHYMAQGLVREGLLHTVVGHRSAPAAVGLETAVAAPYVDNANLLTLNAETRLAAYRGVVSALRGAGFALRDEEPGAALFQFLGLVFDGGRRELRHTPQRAWRLWLALDDL